MRAVRLGMVAAALAVLVPAASTGCSSDTHETQKTGGVDIIGTVSSALNAASVDHINVTVSSASTAFSQTSQLTKDGNGVWSGRVTSIPPGSDYVVSGAAWGDVAQNQELYTSLANNVTIAAGPDAQLTLNFHSTASYSDFQNNAPVISALAAAKKTVALGETISIGVTASDPDSNDTLTYAWSSTGGGSFVNGDTTDANVQWTAPNVSEFETLEVTVTDNHGASSVGRIFVIIGDGGTATGAIAVSAVFYDAPTVTGMTFSGEPRSGQDITVTLSVQGGAGSCASGDAECTRQPYAYIYNTCDSTQSYVTLSWTPGPASTISQSLKIDNTSSTCYVRGFFIDAAGAVINAQTNLNLTQPGVTYGP